MASNAPITTLGSVADIVSESYSERMQWSHFKYLDTGNITQNRIDGIQSFGSFSELPSRARKIIKSGDIVYSLVRPNQRHFGILKNVPENLLVSTGFAVIRGKKNISDSKYLYYHLSQDLIIEYLHTIAEHSTSAYPAIRPDDISQLTIALPPLPTQIAIAHILGTLDDKIELLRSMNETLEAMARGLFKSWFIDFDPVHKKAEGQPTGLPPEIDALFPDSFEDSELGEIPKGWEAVPLSSHFGFLPGYAFKSQDWAESGIPVIKIGSVKPGFVDLSQVSFVSEEIAITANRFRLKVGDIVIGMTGYVGEVGLIPNTKNPPLLNQRVGKFVLTREGTSELGFIYCLTRRKEFKSMVETNSHGTAQANVSSEGIMSIKTVFPKKSLYDVFNAKTQNLFDTLLSNKYEMDILESIRDSLLPKLISGEIELSDKDITKIMEPAK